MVADHFKLADPLVEKMPDRRVFIVTKDGPRK
jgi:hypothetical protein